MVLTSNNELPDSLNPTIRNFNTSQSLPVVFAIAADFDKFGTRRDDENAYIRDCRIVNS